jgi:hypothetical protein
MDELRTYEGWATAGRVVMKGEKAEFFRVSPDGTQCRAVFAHGQTQLLEIIDEIWTTVVPASERPGQKVADPRPKVRVRFEGGMVGVWCGPNKTAIKQLQSHGYHYGRHTRRWQARRNDPEKVIAGLEANGFNVIRETGCELAEVTA